jgi:hypothetical protein
MTNISLRIVFFYLTFMFLQRDKFYGNKNSIVWYSKVFWLQVIELVTEQNILLHEMGGTKFLEAEEWSAKQEHVCLLFSLIGPIHSSTSSFLCKSSQKWADAYMWIPFLVCICIYGYGRFWVSRRKLSCCWRTKTRLKIQSFSLVTQENVVWMQ